MHYFYFLNKEANVTMDYYLMMAWFSQYSALTASDIKLNGWNQANHTGNSSDSLVLTVTVTVTVLFVFVIQQAVKIKAMHVFFFLF